jgi:DNA-binding MarR family transcriptional regulator
MSVPSPQASEHEYDLESQVGFLLRLASQRHAAIFQRHAVDNLTPTQFSTLIKLSEMGEVSQNHLGRSCAMDVATVKGVVDRLKAKGLVDSKPDQTDKRRSIISLAHKGQSLVGELQRTGHVITDETLSPLTAAERRSLTNLLRKIS